MSDLADNAEPVDEGALVRQAQAGDEDAFGLLVRRNYEPTFRHVHAILRDEHAARDVCQEVWLTVWKQLGSFRGEAKFSTWVYPIATRRSIDHLRSRQRWTRRFLPFLAGDDDAPGARTPEPVAEGDPRSNAEEAESNDRFERALATLPPKHRAVLALREIQGLTYEEIAENLGVRRGTVMSRLFNARRMLAKKLGENRHANE